MPTTIIRKSIITKRKVQIAKILLLSNVVVEISVYIIWFLYITERCDAIVNINCWYNLSVDLMCIWTPISSHSRVN